MKLKSFDLDIMPEPAVVEAMSEEAVVEAGAGLGLGVEGGCADFVAAAEAAGVLVAVVGVDVSFALGAPPPMLRLIVFAGAGSLSFLSGVDAPPMLSLIVEAGAGACACGSRSIGARSVWGLESGGVYDGRAGSESGTPGGD